MENIKEIIYSPYFSLLLCIIYFYIGKQINKRFPLSILNPLMIATILLISTLLILDIPTEKFNQGAGFINLFLPPVTVMLALPIYKQLAILKKNLLPILIGAATGSLTAIISVFILSHIFGFDQSILISLLPKSVTTPIGLELSSQLGGIPSITIFAILITGILSAILSPLLIKIFRIKNKIAAGLAIGTSGHALGTTKAMELGETEGAISGLAIGIAGIFTVIFTLLLRPFI